METVFGQVWSLIEELAPHHSRPFQSTTTNVNEKMETVAKMSMALLTALRLNHFVNVAVSQSVNE